MEQENTIEIKIENERRWKSFFNEFSLVKNNLDAKKIIKNFPELKIRKNESNFEILLGDYSAVVCNNFISMRKHNRTFVEIKNSLNSFDAMKSAEFIYNEYL